MSLQKESIKKTEQFLEFLKNIKTESIHCLDIIQKPLDKILNSMKYIAHEPLIQELPPEIMEEILSYLCDAGAYIAASVCTTWENIVRNRFKEKTIVIGKHCSNKYECDNINFFMPVEIFKAGKIHKMDITINIWMRASFVVC